MDVEEVYADTVMTGSRCCTGSQHNIVKQVPSSLKKLNLKNSKESEHRSLGQWPYPVCAPSLSRMIIKSSKLWILSGYNVGSSIVKVSHSGWAADSGAECTCPEAAGIRGIPYLPLQSCCEAEKSEAY